MFSRASLKFKLVSAFLVLSGFLLVIGGVGYWTLQQVVARYTMVAENALPNTMSLGNMRASAYGAVRNITILSNPAVGEEQRQRSLKVLDQRLEEFAKADKDYLATPFLEGEEALYNESNGDWKKLKSTIEEIRSMLGTKDPVVQAKMQKMALETLSAAMLEYLESLDKVRQFQAAHAAAFVKEAKEASANGSRLSILFVAIGSILSLIMGILFANSLSRKFNDLAEQLLHGAEEVASASQQISSASEQLSAAAAEQAASLQETSASVEEISQMVNKNSDNANQSRDVSEHSRAAADTGRKAVDEMISAVQAISSSNEEIGARIQESNREFTDIVKVINEIGSKTKVINDIVFQTRLLSFNASVEAARAGEHGKGFAVVAEEVGNLAQMSGNAAKEISEMLEGSIRQVESIVQRTQTDLDRLMTTGKDKVQTGQSMATQCGKILEEVVAQVSQMNRMATEISSASTEQSQGIQEIGNAMRQLDQVTQQNASAAHQAATASTELSGQAEKLHSLVGDLTAFVQGGSPSQTFAGSVKSGARRAHRPAKETPKSNVLQFKKPSPASPAEAPRPEALKMAGGSDVAPPLDSDPRFRDI